MGLDTTHDCWHGAYSSFTRWRTALGRARGLPIVKLPMFAGGEPTIDYPDADGLPDGDPLRMLLEHSDCDGSIPASDCVPLADALEALLPALDAMGDGGGHIGAFGDKTRTFIAGLRRAAAAGEDVEFR
jgi:hypothetical protein